MQKTQEERSVRGGSRPQEAVHAREDPEECGEEKIEVEGSQDGVRVVKIQSHGEGRPAKQEQSHGQHANCSGSKKHRRMQQRRPVYAAAHRGKCSCAAGASAATTGGGVQRLFVTSSPGQYIRRKSLKFPAGAGSQLLCFLSPGESCWI